MLYMVAKKSGVLGKPGTWHFRLKKPEFWEKLKVVNKNH